MKKTKPTRRCINEDVDGVTESKCNHLHIKGSKYPCSFLGSIVKEGDPQPFCVIRSGFGSGIKIDYEKLNGLDPHPSWVAIMEAQRVEENAFKLALK